MPGYGSGGFQRASADGIAASAQLSEATVLYNGTTFDRARSIGDNADGLVTNATGNARSAAMNFIFNGTTYDRQRGNVETGSVLSLTTSSTNGLDQTNFNHRGLKVIIDVTAITGTNFTVTVQGKDPTSGKYFTLLTSAAITGTGTTVLTVYPGVTASANVAVSDILPRTWRVISTNTAISALTATCAAVLIV